MESQNYVHRWVFYVKTEFFHISERLKERKGSNIYFGGLYVVLVGYPMQLPPVLAENLWVEGLSYTRIDDVNGHTVYIQFSDVVV